MSIEKYPQNILLPTVPSTHVCRHFLWCPALHVINRVHDVYLRNVWQTAVTAFVTYIYVMQGTEGVNVVTLRDWLRRASCGILCSMVVYYTLLAHIQSSDRMTPSPLIDNI